MLPFIYSKRNGKHIIDLFKTYDFIEVVYDFLYNVAKSGGKVLFLGCGNRRQNNGTRKRVNLNREDDSKLTKELVKEVALRSNSYYINQRWLGGTLTNFKTINSNFKRLHDLSQLFAAGEIEKYTKNEQISFKKQLDKLEKFVGGIKEMKGLPAAIVVINPTAEMGAILEARKVNVPVVAIANTNVDPNLFDLIVPANNTSFKTIFLLLNIFADAICDALDLEKKIVGLEEKDIILPEIQRRQFNRYNQHRDYNRGGDNNNSYRKRPPYQPRH